MPREGYRVITVKDEVYSTLEAKRIKNETVPDVIQRLAQCTETILDAILVVVYSTESERSFYRKLAEIGYIK